MSTLALILAALTLAAPHAWSPTSTPERVALPRATVIEDVPCAAGHIWRWPASSRLQQCTLDRDAVVRGATLPKGAVVSFHPDGTHDVTFLPRTTSLDGHACRGGGNNFMTRFHADGRLKLCWMPEDAVIQRVPCGGFSIWHDVVRRQPSGVEFHANGRLASCRVTRDVVILGVAVAGGQRVHLTLDGRVVSSRHP